MNIQRFCGANSREAMLKVKAALGDEALIIANRVTDAGTEIIAAADVDIPEATASDYQPAPDAQKIRFEPEPAAFFDPVEPEEGGAGSTATDEFETFLEAWTEQAASPSPTGTASSIDEEPASPRDADAMALSETNGEAPSRPTVSVDDLSERLMAEVRDVKQLITTSTARQQASDSNSGRIYRMLLSACFSEELASELSLELPEHLQQLPWNAEPLRDWLVRQLTLRRLCSRGSHGLGEDDDHSEDCSSTRDALRLRITGAREHGLLSDRCPRAAARVRQPAERDLPRGRVRGIAGGYPARTQRQAT